MDRNSLNFANLLGNLSAGVFILMAIGLYLLPTIIGLLRKKRNWISIALVNVLLGWTIIGWGIMVVEAFKSDDAP